MRQMRRCILRFSFIIPSFLVYVLTIRINSNSAVSVAMVSLVLIPPLIHFMLGGTPGIVRYTQRTAGIDEALSQYPQH